MRFFSILTAILVMASLYMLVFERPAVLAFASGGEMPETEADAAPQAPGAAEAPGAVAVIAVHSSAEAVDEIVLVRGRSEAARTVEVRAETSGRIISEPLRKGAFVEEGEELCRIDPGTREVALAEAVARVAEAEANIPAAEARLLEAQAGVPTAAARLVEAESRLVEAEINFNVAQKLSEDGFASETRVAGAEAAVESARAGVIGARSQLQGAEAAVQSAKSGIQSAAAGVQGARSGVAAAQRQIEQLSIAAPFAGLLESDAAELGSLLQPGSLCATIIQLDPIKLVGFVPEAQVDKVSVGAVAGARLASGREVRGRVVFLSRSADPNTRTFRVELEVPNADLSIRDGQTAEIVIRVAGQRAHLIPQSALTLDNDGRLGVRLVDADSRAQFHAVSVLRDTVQGIYVGGLPEAADIIVVGQEFVTDAVPVKPSFEEILK